MCAESSPCDKLRMNKVGGMANIAVLDRHNLADDNTIAARKMPMARPIPAELSIQSSSPTTEIGDVRIASPRLENPGTEGSQNTAGR
jgi:hypothetical protein